MNVTRYTEWYNQSTNDPYNGNYANLFRLFEASIPPIDVTGEDLLSAIVTAHDSKLAFVMLGVDGRIHVVHRLMVHTVGFGESEAPHHRIVTAMLGDVSASGGHFVEIPPRAFALVDSIPVRTPAEIRAAIQSYPDAPQLAVDPHASDETVRSRFYMLIPPNLTSRVLSVSTSSSESLTPRDLWIQFAEPLDDVHGRDCAPFVNWCRLAYEHGIGIDNPLCKELPPTLPNNSIITPFHLKILRQDLPQWEAEFKMDDVEHTALTAGSGVLLPLSVDIDAMQVFFGDTEIVLPPLPDYEYLDEIMERVNQLELVNEDDMIAEEKLVALVKEKAGNSNDWRARRVAIMTNLPLKGLEGSENCGEMFLQQTVYSPIAELFCCFNITLYCADKQVDCAHVVRCKNTLLTEERYQVSCRPDSTLRLTDKFYVGSMMEIKPYGTDKKSLKFDKYKCILMSSMSVLAFEAFLLENKKKEANRSKKAKFAGSKAVSKVKLDSLAIPFVLAEHDEATLYVTQLLDSTPVVFQLISISFTNDEREDRKRKSEFMAMLAVLVADVFSTAKKHRNLNNFFSTINTFGQTSHQLKNALSQTSSKVNEPKAAGTQNKQGTKGHSQHTVNPSEREDAAMQVATRNGQVQNLSYPFPRTHKLCLDDDTDGQRYQWEADMKFYQQESPFYFKGTYHSIPVFCKVWREGDSRTHRQNIVDEVMHHQKANMNAISSTKVFSELTALDIVCGGSADDNSCHDMYHVMVTEFHRGDDVMEPDILLFARKLVKAVLSLHNIGILHCDVKPSNILWDAQQKVVRLIDFGHAQDSINAQSYPATQMYEAPEISDKYPHSKMSDAFAVGRTLEEVCKKFTSCDAKKVHVLAKSLQMDFSKRMSLENGDVFLTATGNSKGSFKTNCNLENIENGHSMTMSF